MMWQKINKVMNLKIVAEGVETEEDWDFLAAAGATEAQGYYISRPMAGEELVGWVERWTVGRTPATA